MLTDAKLYLSEGQAITSSAVSENILDFGVTDPNIGEGTKLVLHVEVEEDFATGDGAVLTVDVQDSADGSSFSSIGLKKESLAASALSSGTKIFEIALPYSLRRYLRINYTVGTGTFTAGKVNAYIALA